MEGLMSNIAMDGEFDDVTFHWHRDEYLVKRFFCFNNKNKKRLTKHSLHKHKVFENWWSRGGSNSWPPACKAGALPAELRPLACIFCLEFRCLIRSVGHVLYVHSLLHSKNALLKTKNSNRVYFYPNSPIRRAAHNLVGLGGFEPPTSPLSGVRSNQLSYRPKLTCLFVVMLRCFSSLNRSCAWCTLPHSLIKHLA